MLFMQRCSKGAHHPKGAVRRCEVDVPPSGDLQIVFFYRPLSARPLLDSCDMLACSTQTVFRPTQAETRHGLTVCTLRPPATFTPHFLLERFSGRAPLMSYV